MKTVCTSEPHRLPVKPVIIITMPLGLLGFEQVKKFVLLSQPGEEPFLWLQMLDNASQGFVVISPCLAMPDYSPDISAQDVEFLKLQNPDDAIVLNIVTVRPNGQSTVNLKGPIVINRNTLVAKQCIPNNVAGFSLQHSIQSIMAAA